MKPPPQLIIPASARDVTAEVKRLLRAAEVRGRIPTPKPQILACARLVETGELDLAEYEESFSERAALFFHKAMNKVRGFLDRRTAQIYIDPNLPDPRKAFVTYHEVIHRILPWQDVTYTEDDDLTLSRDCRTIFESEANYGAAEILFQCDRFETEARDHGLSVASALHLSRKYEASFHSSLRRFVERNHRPCLLLVLKATSRENADGGTSYRVSYSITSTLFESQFGDPLDFLFITRSTNLGKFSTMARVARSS